MPIVGGNNQDAGQHVVGVHLSDVDQPEQLWVGATFLLLTLEGPLLEGLRQAARKPCSPEILALEHSDKQLSTAGNNVDSSQ